MKILLFTLLYLVAGALFTNSYAEPNSTAVSSPDAFFHSDALFVEADAPSADDLDTLLYGNLERYLVSVYSIKSPVFNTDLNSRPSHYYHTRAPPIIA